MSFALLFLSDFSFLFPIKTGPRDCCKVSGIGFFVILFLFAAETAGVDHTHKQILKFIISDVRANEMRILQFLLQFYNIIVAVLLHCCHGSGVFGVIRSINASA